MKYILDDNEMEKMRKRHEYNGYSKAENLLSAILSGERNLFVSHPDKPKNLDFQEYRENVWKQLIDKLDKESK